MQLSQKFMLNKELTSITKNWLYKKVSYSRFPILDMTKDLKVDGSQSNLNLKLKENNNCFL